MLTLIDMVIKRFTTILQTMLCGYDRQRRKTNGFGAESFFKSAIGAIDDARPPGAGAGGARRSVKASRLSGVALALAVHSADELVEAHRAADDEALGNVAVHVAQLLQADRVFDPLGNHGATE